MRGVTAELADVRFGYGAEPILTDVGLTLRESEFTVLAGANGSGKSTLLKLMLGLLRPDAGTVRVLGGSPTDPEVRRHIGYAPQGLRMATSLPVSVSEVVAVSHDPDDFHKVSDRILIIVDGRIEQITHEEFHTHLEMAP